MTKFAIGLAAAAVAATAGIGDRSGGPARPSAPVVITTGPAPAVPGARVWRAGSADEARALAARAAAEHAREVIAVGPEARAAVAETRAAGLLGAR